MRQIRILVLILLMFCVLTQVAESGMLRTWFGGFWDRTLVPLEDANPQMCKLRPVMAIPVIKITRSTRADTFLDVGMLTSTGGGLSIQWLEYNSRTRRWYCNFSFSPITLLFSGNVAEVTALNISYMTTIGFLNNKLVLGLGYDFGTVKDRERLFGAITIGLNFN